MLTVLRRSLFIKGYINTEFAAEHYDSFLKEVAPLVRSGDIRYRQEQLSKERIPTSTRERPKPGA